MQKLFVIKPYNRDSANEVNSYLEKGWKVVSITAAGGLAQATTPY